MTNPRILWVPGDHPKLDQSMMPPVLFAAVKPRTLAKWLKRNDWASTIPKVLFTDDDADLWARRTLGKPVTFAPKTGAAPCCAYGVSDGLATLLLAQQRAEGHGLSTLEVDTPGVKSDLDASLHYVTAVVSVASEMKNAGVMIVGWIVPEADHGLGAVVAANCIGRLTAYSQSRGGPPPMVATVAQTYGVDVTVIGYRPGKFSVH